MALERMDCLDQLLGQVHKSEAYGVTPFDYLLPSLPPTSVATQSTCRAMTFRAQVVERHTEAHINGGTTPALGSYEGGGYERQDEGR
jgi:hypothetical protein